MKWILNEIRWKIAQISEKKEDIEDIFIRLLFNRIDFRLIYLLYNWTRMSHTLTIEHSRNSIRLVYE